MTTVSKFANEKLSASYAKFRPVYPRKVLEIIISRMNSNGYTTFDTAVDVACGSGQGTFLLCGSFKSVIGLDVSETQIEQAKQKQKSSTYSNVEFLVGDAHNLPMNDSSVDLMTCAMAWHWLDADRFYSEAKRVLKPGGYLVVYGHGVNVEDNPRVKSAFKTFIGELFKCNCFAKQNLHVLNNYEAVELPFDDVQRIEFPFPQQINLEQLVGFFLSVSMYKEYCEKYPQNDLLERIRTEYESFSDKCDVEDFTFPGVIITGKK